MPFVKKTDVRKAFIGRTGELLFFVQNILKPEEPTHNIISISGQGGVGKSTLLTRFIDQAHSTEFKDYCLPALVDERQTTPASIMERFADQLHMKGEFEKALTQYREILHKMQSERETMRDAVLHRVPDFAGAAVEGVPVVGPILREGAKLTTSFLVDEYHTFQMRRDMERLENPVGDLTKAFVTELNRLADNKSVLGSSWTKRERRIILFFDTFERLAVEVAPWLLDHFLDAQINGNVVLVVAGRDPIDHSTPDDPKRWLPYHDNDTIYSIPLNSFTEDETRAYLTNQGITDPGRIDTVWKLSHGLPLYLGLLASNPQGDFDPTKDVVDNFLRWISEHEQIKRRLALDAALLSRPFNQDDLAAFTYLAEDERSALYRWLTGLPFVRSNLLDGRYRYHDLAQELFSRHLYQLSQQEYYATRRNLASYYQELLKKIQVEGGEEVYRSDEWLELVIALTNQLFLLPDEASHIKAIEEVLRAYKHTSTEQDGEIVRVLRELSQEQSSNQANADVRQTAKQLQQYIETEPESQEFLTTANYLLERLAHKSAFSPELLARIYRNRGRTYSSSKDYQQAIEDFNQALNLDPKDASTHVYRGIAYRQRKEYQEAIQDFSRAIELDPEYVWAYEYRGITHSELKDYQNALKDFGQALELDPNDAWAYGNRGETYRLLKEYQQAIKDFGQALELDPNDAWAYGSQGQVHLALKEYQRAIEDFNRALELDSKLNWVYTERGETYRQLKEYQQAIKDFDRAIELSPNYAWAYAERGTSYRELKNYQQAIEDFDRALELGPDDAWAYTNRGQTYRQLKEYQRAIKDFDHALELDSNYTWAYENRGETYRQLKEYQRAIKDFDHALELDSEDAWAYGSRGQTYTALKEHQQAIKDFDRAIELDPKLDWVYINRGTVYLWMKDLKQAKSDFTQGWELDSDDVGNDWAIQWSDMCEEKPVSEEMAAKLEAIASIHPNDSTAHVCLGVALWLLGRFKEALMEFELAISLDPDEFDPYFWKGMAYASLGQDENAIMAIEKALELELPPILLLPLRWLEQDRPDFYQRYAAPLLARYEL